MRWSKDYIEPLVRLLTQQSGKQGFIPLQAVSEIAVMTVIGLRHNEALLEGPNAFSKYVYYSLQ